MAVHTYKCSWCGHTEDVKVKLGKASEAPDCNGLAMKRIYHPFGFTIK